MNGSAIDQVICVVIVGMLACSSYFGIIAAPNYGINNISNDETQDIVLENNEKGNFESDELADWFWPDGDGDTFDIRSLLDSYRENADHVQVYHTSSYSYSQDGFDLTYETHDNTMTISASVSDYGIITYDFDEGTYESIVISGMQLANTYGTPVLPYSKVLFNIPLGAQILDVRVRSKSTESIYGLDVVPGPKPVAIYGDMMPDTSLFFNPEFYSSSTLLPDQIVTSEVVHHGDEQALMIEINPLQYNPIQKQATLHSDLIIEVTYDIPITKDAVTYNGWSSYDGTNYTIITSDDFESVLTNFTSWKTELGFQVQVVTVEDILASYSGRDNPEKIRSFIQLAYAQNHTEYFLLIGDCDIVPVREVIDPAYGPGLDNGTEPSDLYYECLDGDWDANMNNQFGEMDDNVDLFPEVKVGRLPVQTPIQAAHVLQQIIDYESNPTTGDWLNDFMLIAVDCFGYGDGVVMTEAEINQKYLFDSFFDVYRYYPTDGSLSTEDIVSKINSGINIIDFFDHGAYDVWVDALSVDDVLDLSNGNKSFFAFAMACETAAFDVEYVEPVIGEAFFRNPNGGASTYIGATRVAWAGYDCFDGLHNKFWDFFLADALANRAASPKDALHAAINYMATTFDTTNAPTLESIYQAIYFGDPSLILYWKHNVTTVTEPVEVNETVNLNGTCLRYNGYPIEDNIDILVKDPLGTTVYSDTVVTDSNGTFSISFLASSQPGTYTVETSIIQPFQYKAITTFVVGTLNMTLQIDNEPIYYTNLEFSGTTSLGSSGSATLLDSTGSILGMAALSIIGETFSGLINITKFGPLHLYVQFDNGSMTCGKSIDFRVIRGDVLILADNAGTNLGPEYPGGWADYNWGDAANPGDYILALKDEYNITVFNTMDITTPPLSFLNDYDVVIATTGDNFYYPLSAPDNFLLDVLYEYHLNGGEILFEGASILSALYGSYAEYFSSLFHAEFVDNILNDGSLELCFSSHPISSGLPSSIPLEAGLGSLYVDVLNPTNNSLQVASYGGSYTGDSAIIGLAPSSYAGGIVFIGFSIDAIADQGYRDVLIQNAVSSLLYPTLLTTLSDDALKTGTSETIDIEVSDSATGTPVKGARVIFEGCGVSEVNNTIEDGTCSILVNPSSEGLIQVNVTKSGYLNFTTSIIVYDQSIVSLSASPCYLERSVETLVTITAKDFYEHNPLENCFINVTGLGNSDTGFTNESGMISFILSASIQGIIKVEGSLSGYISSSCNIAARLNILVLPGIGTDYASYCCWDYLMLHWSEFGEYPLYIDYTTFQNSSALVTLDLLEELNPDVLSFGFILRTFLSSEVDAIKAYVTAGHGFVVDSGVLYYDSTNWQEFLGLTGLYDMQGENAIVEITQQVPSHAIFNKVSDPYVSGAPLVVYPSYTGWDSSKLLGACYIGADESSIPRGAIITYHGMVYISTIPQYMSNIDDCQLLYNAFLWSKYAIPEHELVISLDVSKQVEISTTVPIHAAVINSGTSTETDIDVSLYINSILVDSMTIPSLTSGSTEALEYSWSVTNDGIYNVTATVDVVPGEDSVFNNKASEIVLARSLIDYIMEESEFTWYNAKANGANLMISGDDEYQSVILPFSFPYYDCLYNVIHISSNGWLSFTNPNPYDYANVGFPSSHSRYAYAVAPMWDDLAANNNIYFWETEDWAVIEYNNYNYLGGTPLGTFEVVFFSDGHIEFNFLTLEQTYYATVGLNYGDGIYYNSYESSLLSYTTNISLAFHYYLPEHDLKAGLSAPSYAFIDESTDLIPYVRNMGTSSEVYVELTMSINDVDIVNVMVTNLNSLESFEYPYSWTPSEGGYYYIEVYVTPVVGEHSTSNNYISALILVEAPRSFEILSPLEGETVSGGLVFVEIDSDDYSEIDYIDIYLNDEFLFTYTSGFVSEIAVPVFENGTNEITFEIHWYDAISEASVSFVSTEVAPLLYPEVGDYYNWYMLSGSYNFIVNFTFGLMVNDFDVEVNIYEEIRDETNSTIATVSYDVIASTLNGYIPTGTLQGARLFFMTGLDSPTITGDSAGFGDALVGTSWDEVLYVNSYGIWRGYAVWNSFSSESNDNASIFRSNGLLATYAYNGGYTVGWVVDSSFFADPDTSPPEWLKLSEIIFAEAGEPLRYQIDVFDETGINSFTINDTARFRLTYHMSYSGLLTNVITLNIGRYGLLVTVVDPYGYSTTAAVTVIVQDTTAPSWLITQQNYTVQIGTNFAILLAAEDFSGIDHWSVNDTRFAVNETGWLTSIETLQIGTYILKVSVFDTYENENTMTIVINIIPTSDIPTGDIFLIYMTVVFTSVVVGGFIVILLIRKRIINSRGG